MYVLQVVKIFPTFFSPQELKNVISNTTHKMLALAVRIVFKDFTKKLW